MAEKGGESSGEDVSQSRGSGVTWKVSDTDVGVVPQSSSFSIHNLPDITSSDAPSTAATKLRLLLQYLEAGDSRPVSLAEIHSIVSYSANVLNHCSKHGGLLRKRSTVFEELNAVQDVEVRGWLSSTFTRTAPRHKPRKRKSFKSVATSVMIGRYIESICKDHQKGERGLHEYPPAMEELFKTLDSWDFNIFEAEALSTHQPLRYVGHEVFKRHDLLNIHKIPPATLDAFLVQVEKGYKSHQNSYHNETHGADVLQTVHALILSTELTRFWLGSLELLALLLAATVHDVDHPGTTNTFQTNTKSDLALLYNDRSVLENHHLSYSFRLLMNEETNILQRLNSEDFTRVRGLVIDMVLATDMSGHFDHLNEMKSLLSAPNAVVELTEEHRSKVLCFLLHSADVSNPAKPWDIHTRWTTRIMEEFFQQGDCEKQLSLPISPLCDRNTTSIPGSQLGFIQHIVRPVWDVCGDMLDVVTGGGGSATHSLSTSTTPSSKPWLYHLTHNWEQWTERRAHT